MSWQEELRKLDEELAAGRLSADDYRVRRDQVLSSAVTQDAGGQGQDAPQQAPPQQSQPQQAPPENSAESTQVVQPVQAPQQQSSADSTQIVNQPDLSAERTQAVPAWQTQQPQQYQAPGSPAGGFQQPQHQQYQQQQYQQQPFNAWNAPEADASPPWGGGDLPAMHAAEPDAWVKQGPEAFEEKGGNKGKIVAIVLAVVLVAGLGVGAFFIWGTGGDGEPSADPTNQPAPPQDSSAAPTQQPQDGLPIAQLPGKRETYQDVKSFADVPGTNLLTPPEVAAYRDAQAGEAKLVVQHLDGGNVAIILLTTTGGKIAADGAAKELGSIQVTNGAARASQALPGVQVTEIDAKGENRAQVRGHYASGDVLVRVEVNNENSLDSAKAAFQQVIQAQTQVLPANG